MAKFQASILWAGSESHANIQRYPPLETTVAAGTACHIVHLIMFLIAVPFSSLAAKFQPEMEN